MTLATTFLVLLGAVSVLGVGASTRGMLLDGYRRRPTRR
jgi:hypothetical protein